MSDVERELSTFLNEDDSDLLLITEDINQKGTCSRFALTTSEELEEKRRNRIPENTRRKAAWAIRLFNDWHSQWKVQLSDHLKVYHDLDEMSVGDIDYCLQFFFAEVRKADGSKYPPRTLKEIAAAIQHHFQYNLRQNISIFNDQSFSGCREILDAEMKLSAAEGNVKRKRKSNSISFELEKDLWEAGAFGVSNPRQLIETLIYHLGLHLALRACLEHRNLEFGENSQLTLKTGDYGEEFLEYVERCSKNKDHGLKNSKKEPKVTTIYPNRDNPNRCAINLYKTYVSHRPELNEGTPCPAFYLTPHNSPKTNCWYKSSPMGVNTISGTLKRLTSMANDGKLYSNTSLRRTAKTRIVNAGIPREVAKMKTGHVSNSADDYVENSVQHERNMTSAIYGQVRGRPRNENSSAFEISALSFPGCYHDFISGNTFNNCSISINYFRPSDENPK
jgi:hypothetical protein